MNYSLQGILTPVYAVLSDFAQSDDFWTKTAITFGSNYDSIKLTTLRNQWQNQDFSQLPEIEVLDNSILGDARGAYATSLNKIYLSDSFLATAKQDDLIAVILEEIGHYLDAQINIVDTVGDEGELFSALVRNVEISRGELQRLKTEDDTATVTIGGQAIVEIEQSSYTLGVIQGSRYLNDSVNSFDYGDNWTFQISATGTTNNFIDVLSNSTSVDLILELYDQYGTFITSANYNNYTNNYEYLSLSGAPAGTYTAVVYDYFLGQYVYPYDAYYTLLINAPQASSLPSITLTVSPASVAEDGTNKLIYTFTRTSSTTNALTVNYTVGGDATFNNDYTQTGATSFSANNGKITFAAGSSTATLTVDPTPDTEAENNQTVTLTLATGTGYTIGTNTAVTGTITNDDAPPVQNNITLVVNPNSVTEDGTTNLVYTFTRSGSTANNLIVNYTVGGDAIFNNDYTQTGASTFSANNGTITFAAGSSTAKLTVDPTADTTSESDKTVSLTLANGTGYTIVTNTAVTGTIVNNDNSVVGIVVNGDANANDLQGGIGDDTIKGLDGNDTITGFEGADVMFGGAGNDTYYVSSNLDVVSETNPDSTDAGGTDTIYATVSYTLSNFVENLIFEGESNLNGTGNTLNNTITGNQGKNLLIGNNGNDTLRGGNGNDSLTGGKGNDSLIGGNGNDTLVGGLGNDSLTGGVGKDYFRFNAKTEGKDKITDFVVKDDTILVSKTGFGAGLTVGTLAVTQFKLGSAATTSVHRLGYDSSNGKLWFDSDGNGATAAIQIATLNTGLGLTNNDIVVF